jgi:hypothetical protein
MAGGKLPEVCGHSRSDEEVRESVDAGGNGTSCVTLLSNGCDGNAPARMSGSGERSDRLCSEGRQRATKRLACIVVDDLDEVRPLL